MTLKVDEIPKSYSEAVSLLARWQGESGPPDVRIFWFPDPAEQSVYLIEVSGEFLGSGKVQSLPLGSSAEFPFRSAVALLTPQEWDAVEGGQLQLPHGWNLESRRQVWP